MNVAEGRDPSVDPQVWLLPEMRAALRDRDVGQIYAVLRRRGLSQRRLAALTGQAQSEISEILAGRRQVESYDLLGRIADGLGIPRGYMGLAYDDETAAGLTGTAPGEDESVQRRMFLGYAAAIAAGGLASGIESWKPTADTSATPVPHHVGVRDIEQIEDVVRALRRLDYSHGGGTVRDAAMGQLAWVSGLRTASAASGVERRLDIATADLHNLIGWSSFDCGLYDAARYHFACALEAAKTAEEPSLVANVLYRVGKLHLHRGWPTEALRLFQIGQLAAQDSRSHLAVAVLHANEAWAYAELGDAEQVFAALDRADHELSRADLDRAPSWVRFFGQADLDACAGVAITVLARHEPQLTDRAIECLTRSAASRGEDMARSRAFEMTALSTNHFMQGDCDQGRSVADEVFGLAGQVRSVRILHRLEPLRVAAATHPTNDDARVVVDRITELQAGT